MRTPQPWRIKQMKRQPEDQLVDDAAIQQSLQARIIQVSPTQSKGHLLNFFTIQEPTKLRPTLDCTILNRFLQVRHFKMEGVLALRDIIEQDDFICKVNFKDAYVVVPIHQDSQKYWTFMKIIPPSEKLVLKLLPSIMKSLFLMLKI